MHRHWGSLTLTRLTEDPSEPKCHSALTLWPPLDRPEDTLSTGASCLLVGGPNELSVERAGFMHGWVNE